MFLVTGSNSGVGLELAKLLYGLNGTVYVASRSTEKVRAAIETIKAQVTTKTGRLEALQLNLADLPSIGRSAGEFLRRETRLDVLVHNAGLMMPTTGSKTDLGYDLEMGTNCLGPFLLSHYLEPILKKTAATTNSPLGVRVVWVSSMLATSVPDGGLVTNDDGSPKVLKNAMENYMQSKVGDHYLAVEKGLRSGKDGIINVSLSPGLLNTELQRTIPAPLRMMMRLLMLKDAKYGAYTELFASLSPTITMDHNGEFILPWGRVTGVGSVPKHIQQGIEDGKAASFYKWCDQETKRYQ